MSQHSDITMRRFAKEGILFGVLGAFATTTVVTIVNWSLGNEVKFGEVVITALLTTIAITAGLLYLLKKSFKNYGWKEIREHTGIVAVFRGFDECENEILEALETCKNSRIFLQIGTSVLSGADTIYERLDEINWSSSTNLKLMFASEDSEYLSEAVAHKRSSTRARWLEDLRRARRQLDLLKHKVGDHLEYRQHREPFLWRLFVFDNSAYIQPYLFGSGNSKRANVIKVVRESSTTLSHEQSLYELASRYFDDIWDRNPPTTKDLASLVPASDNVTVVGLLKISGAYVFVIPARKLLDQSVSHAVEFQLPGGKPNRSESYSRAMRRELKEELGINIEIRDALQTHQLNGDGSIQQIGISSDSEARPRWIHTRQRGNERTWILIYDIRLKGKVRSPAPLKELGGLVTMTPQVLRDSIAHAVTPRVLSRNSDRSRLVMRTGSSVRDSSRLLPNETIALLVQAMSPDPLIERPASEHAPLLARRQLAEDRST